MLLTVYVPPLRDFFPEANGNWDAAIADTLLSIAIFCDDRALFDSAATHVLHGPGNGSGLLVTCRFFMIGASCPNVALPLPEKRFARRASRRLPASETHQ